MFKLSIRRNRVAEAERELIAARHALNEHCSLEALARFAIASSANYEAKHGPFGMVL